MMKRVPKGRSRANELMPSVTEQLAKEINEGLNVVAAEEPEKTQLIEERRAQVYEILDRCSSNHLKTFGFPISLQRKLQGLWRLSPR